MRPPLVIEDLAHSGALIIIVGVKGQATRICAYVRPRAQSENSRWPEDRKNTFERLCISK